MFDTLYFSPYAFAKMKFIRDIGDTEVSFFALSRKDTPNLVYDVRMPKQKCFSAYTEFLEEQLPEFFETLVDEGLSPAEFSRIWCHTHPGNSASPSGTDEETFKREFSGHNWAIMFIISKGTNANTTCKLKYKNHPDLVQYLGDYQTKNISVVINVDCDSYAVNSTAREQWKKEYEGCVQLPPKSTSTIGFGIPYQPSEPFYSHYAQSKHYGAGWRKRNSGTWFWDPKTCKQDENSGITTSPDMEKTSNYITSQEWRNALKEVPSENLSVPECEKLLGRRLTRKERRLVANGNIPKYIEDQLKKAKEPVMVPLQNLETSRNLLTEQSDIEWLDEASAVYENSLTKATYQKYKVTRADGEVFTGVWARSKQEAVDLVEERVKLRTETQNSLNNSAIVPQKPIDQMEEFYGYGY